VELASRKAHRSEAGGGTLLRNRPHLLQHYSPPWVFDTRAALLGAVEPGEVAATGAAHEVVLDRETDNVPHYHRAYLSYRSSCAAFWAALRV
jgi:hypothetical protein